MDLKSGIERNSWCIWKGTDVCHPNFSLISLDVLDFLGNCRITLLFLDSHAKSYSFGGFPPTVMLKIGILSPQLFQNSELHHC